MNKYIGYSAAAVVFAGSAAFARPGEHIRFADGSITLKPYVNMSYTWDSNVSSSKHSRDDSIFAVRPGMDFEWKRPDKEFNLNGGVWYGYNHYAHRKRDAHHTIGEKLSLSKDFIAGNGNKWSLRISESYRKINANDAITHDDGNGVWRNRDVFNVAGALSERIKRFHWGVHGTYSRLSYDNDDYKYQRLIGWDSWAVGGEAGWLFSKWTDVLLTGSYTGYTQDGRKYSGDVGRSYTKKSNTWTLMTGIGSHLADSERLSYRALVGASRHEYGSRRKETGWTYQLSFNWNFRRQWAFSVRGSSYYHPSEYTYGQSSKTYTLGAGLTYAMTQKLNWTGDVLYRKSMSACNDYRVSSYDHNDLHARLALHYKFQPWAEIYGAVGYVTRISDSDSDSNDYNRFRGSLGLTFTY